MPILPREIKRQVDRKSRPDRMGEEGILHIVEAGEARYFAKQWYKNHDTQLAVSPEHGGSPMSPYWHKLKFYEYKLIHDAFPDHTVEMVGGFDPRIQKQADGTYGFVMMQARPTTITKEVTGDPVKTAAVQAVLDEAYSLMLPYREAVRGKPRNDAGEEAFQRVVIKADAAIQQILGKEVHLDQFQGGYTVAEFSRLMEVVRRIDPHSAIIQLLEHGIVPIHPEFNFIPGTATSHPQSPHGTFIECAIRDVNRFKSHMHQRFSEPDQQILREKFDGKLSRYLLYRILDQIFDNIIRTPLGAKEAWKFQPNIQTTLFQILEAVREFSKHQPITDVMVQSLQRDIVGKFARGFSPDHVVVLLKTEILDNLRR